MPNTSCRLRSFVLRTAFLAISLVANTQGWMIQFPHSTQSITRSHHGLMTPLRATALDNDQGPLVDKEEEKNSRRVTIIGAGWGGLSAANALASSINGKNDEDIQITVVEASPRVGGLVRDGFTSLSGKRPAEAGQHGFWDNYHNIYRLFDQLTADKNVEFDVKTALTDYAEQGQYSPNGMEAVWPIYRDQTLKLPTGLAQAVYTRFLNLPLLDRITAFPLVLAFSEFDGSPEAWKRFDQVSFRDLCLRLGVSRRCYDEAFEPMILTGLFAPGAECSAAAALGMAYFFVLQSQTAFDVQWCRGNIGEVIFDPWVKQLEATGKVEFLCSTRVTGFDIDKKTSSIGSTTRITNVKCTGADGKETSLESDDVILAVGAKALNSFVRFCPELAEFPEFRRFANLRGTSVLATRLFLDQKLDIPYSANACWGFDEGVGMTFFDIEALHGSNATTVADAPGSVVEVDYYHSSTLLTLSDEEIVEKAKKDLDTILGTKCKSSKVADAAVVRLPEGVNWFFPGSYRDMPDIKSKSIENMYFAGDVVHSSHGSWSQEKAFVTGIEAANSVLGRKANEGILPLAADEVHVRFGKEAVALARNLFSGFKTENGGPSLVDFLF